jgi:hypothetical protein
MTSESIAGIVRKSLSFGRGAEAIGGIPGTAGEIVAGEAPPAPKD